MMKKSTGVMLSGLAAGVLTVGSALPSIGQSVVIGDAEELATGRNQTVVVTQRPLRTFRGEAVRVGRYAESEREIGVVRPLREVPGLRYGDRFGNTRSFDAYGRPVRLSVGSYLNPYPTYEKEIGVVRPYRVYTPPQRLTPTTYTNPNADPIEPSGGESASTPGRVIVEDIDVTAVTAVPLPDAHRDDPWALLDHGYYREARQQFALIATPEDSVTRTGQALAAALSGDLAGASALMPDAPALPEGTVFRDATAQRLEQTQRYLFEDRPEMQAKLRALIDQGRPTQVTAQ